MPESNEQKLTELMAECESHEILSVLKKEIERRLNTQWAGCYVDPVIGNIDDIGVFYFIHQLVESY